MDIHAGKISEASSIRGFWGSFWHQLNRQRLTSFSAWVTYDILRLWKGNIPGRYTATFVAFLLSGLLHAAAEIATGMSWEHSGVVRYFLTQYFGIIFEDMVQEASTRLGIRPGDKA